MQKSKDKVLATNYKCDQRIKTSEFEKYEYCTYALGEWYFRLSINWSHKAID